MNKYLTTTELAEILNCDKTHITRMAQMQKIPYINIASTRKNTYYRFDLEAVMDALNKRRGGAR